MTEANKPLSLLKTRSYPAYQFHADISYARKSADACMRFTVLTVLEWIRERIGEFCPPEIVLPEPAKFESVSPDAFVSYHASAGFSLDVTSLMEKGIWSARLKEPDVRRNNHVPVNGRSFVTDIGLRLKDDCVECGIRIDVIDPVDNIPEVDFAFRPAFIRRLFANKKICFRQIEKLSFRQAIGIAGGVSLKRLCDLIEAEDNQLPAIIFTHYTARRSVQELVEKLDRELGIAGTENSFSQRLREMTLVPETLELGEPILPYDADDTAEHTIGYARVFAVSPRMFASFRKLFSEKLCPGDILWIEPKCFGGKQTILPYDPAAPASRRENVRKGLIDDAHRYSKHKPYSFGDVVFESSARRIELEERIKTHLQRQHEDDAEESRKQQDELLLETEGLLELYAHDKKIAEEERDRLKAENRNLSDRISLLERRLASATKKGVVIEVPEIEPFFDQEQRDLIISILQDAKKHYCLSGSRAESLLNGILERNELTGEGAKLFEKLKSILYSDNKISESDVSELRALGFVVEKWKTNHFKLLFKGDPQYVFTLPSTASDVRSMKNSYSDIVRKLSIYK